MLTPFSVVLAMITIHIGNTGEDTSSGYIVHVLQILLAL